MTEPAIDNLRATFGAARAFGLDDEEIWQTINRVCQRTPSELRPEDLEDLIAALAGGFSDGGSRGMTWFKVKIKGDLETADAALQGAGITLRERAFAHFVGAGPPCVHALAAVVEADSAEAAEKKVSEKLPDPEGYTLEATKLPQAST